MTEKFNFNNENLDTLNNKAGELVSNAIQTKLAQCFISNTTLEILLDIEKQKVKELEKIVLQLSTAKADKPE